MRHFFHCLLALVLISPILPAAGAYAAETTRTPLLMEGKKALYQRVVSHPFAKLTTTAEENTVVDNKPPIKTFTAFYVFDRKGDFVEVGVSASKADGWLKKSLITDWPQSMTMVFTDRMGRQPVLFFKDKVSLETVCTDPNLDVKILELGKAAGQSTLPQNFPVLATEPKDRAVSEKNFYLLPILATDAPYGDKVKLVRVTSINPGIGGQENKDPAGEKTPAQNGALQTGFVFVIDTSISMKPYIDQALNMIKDIYNTLEKSPHGDKVAFAVVSFRSSVELTPGLEYTSKIISDFKNIRQRGELEAALAKLDEARVSSHAFEEDSFAGVKDAIDKLSWNNYGSRALLLVTDAGPLVDDTAKTQFSPEMLADYLRTHKIYMTVIHVKAPSGSKYHARAAKAYMEAAKQSDNQTSYVPIPAPTPAQGAKGFDTVGRRLAQGYESMVIATAEGQMLPAPTKQSAKNLTPEEEAARIAEATGYAMQLQFLGNAQKVTAPTVMDAWIADADLVRLAQDPTAQPVLAARPAVLLTKSQLSQLREQLMVILDAARKSFLKDDAKNFFQSILSAAAHLSRDPNSFTVKPGQNLAQAGILGEFLEGLPYKSRVMQLTEEDWSATSTGEQMNLIKHLEACIRRYDEYDRDNTHWEGFGSPNRNEWVYRVPLDVLP